MKPLIVGKQAFESARQLESQSWLEYLLQLFMFLHLTKHTAVQVEGGHPLPAGCIKSMCSLGSNDEAQTSPDCL